MPNTHSAPGSGGGPPDDGLADLVAAVDGLAAQELDGLSGVARIERVRAWRRLLDRQEGLWLNELADLDARGAAGAELDQAALSTASWLRSRLRLGAAAARSAVRTARALFGGALPETAAALTAGAISPTHARVIADGTRDLPEHVKLDADPVLVELAGRLDPPQLRRAVTHLRQVADAALDRDAAADATSGRWRAARLAAQLRAAAAKLPPTLGGAPNQPLEVGRATRVVTPAQRSALTVRDGGCVFPDCDRPLAWCEAHHLVSWLDGGPTDLANLALLCRAHHRAVHEGRLAAGPRPRRAVHGHPTAAKTPECRLTAPEAGPTVPGDHMGPEPPRPPSQVRACTGTERPRG